MVINKKKQSRQELWENVSSKTNTLKVHKNDICLSLREIDIWTSWPDVASISSATVCQLCHNVFLKRFLPTQLWIRMSHHHVSTSFLKTSWTCLQNIIPVIIFDLLKVGRCTVDQMKMFHIKCMNTELCVLPTRCFHDILRRSVLASHFVSEFDVFSSADWEKIRADVLQF